MEYKNLAIYCDNYEEINMFLSYCEFIGLLWGNNEKPLDFIPDNGSLKTYFVIIHDRLRYGIAKDYEEFKNKIDYGDDHLMIVSLYEFIGYNTMPTDQELMRFLNG